jgi:hypothetical protein
MKETAVEWLLFEIKGTKWKNANWQNKKLIIEQAKGMEKQHMIEAWDNGFANGYDLAKHDDQANPDDAEQYYNETFK